MTLPKKKKNLKNYWMTIMKTQEPNMTLTKIQVSHQTLQAQYV